MSWIVFFACSVLLSVWCLRKALQMPNGDLKYVLVGVGLGGIVAFGAALAGAVEAYPEPVSKPKPISCVSDFNESGNVCRVKTDKGWCVAVLPDGGKSPRYKPDYVTCP